MNDYEYLFKQDVKEKKDIARSAFHKKGGSKSKKVTLPNERITRKEWETMNGEVKTIQLRKPMTWEEFKALDHDIQERYLNCLVDGYGVRAIDISNMFGISRGAFSGYTSRMKLKTKFSMGARKLTDEQLNAWRAFLNGSEAADVEEEPAVETVEEPVAEETYEPLTYDEFVNRTYMYQKEYLKALRSSFGVGITMIAQMMGVDRETLYSYCVRRGFHNILKGRVKPTKEQQEAWAEFLDMNEEPETEVEEIVEEERPVIAPVRFSMAFEGAMTIDDISDAIRRLVGSNTLNGTIHIDFIGGRETV